MLRFADLMKKKATKLKSKETLLKAVTPHLATYVYDAPQQHVFVRYIFQTNQNCNVYDVVLVSTDPSDIDS